VSFLGGCGVLVVLTIVTRVVIVAEVRSAGQSQQYAAATPTNKM
jgi:hypothetical protein